MSDETARRAALSLAAELLERLRDPGLNELEVREGGVRVRVAKDGAPSALPPPGPAETPAPAHTPRAGAPAKAVAAPLTGVFYRSPSPQAPPFVQVGTVVAVGDVIGLIEAMKLFNEVRSTAAGRVLRVVAESGQLVRAHQPLLELE
ncbi:MAG: biotin carboxyl carrier domain-containing protein [Chloroflexota bacterium]|nr:biotin carboxyl carrier domain-containing protein [Chloroflexota bacterium]